MFLHQINANPWAAAQKAIKGLTSVDWICSYFYCPRLPYRDHCRRGVGISLTKKYTKKSTYLQSLTLQMEDKSNSNIATGEKSNSRKGSRQGLPHRCASELRFHRPQILLLPPRGELRSHLNSSRRPRSGRRGRPTARASRRDVLACR